MFKTIRRAIADLGSFARFLLSHVRYEFVVLDHDALGTFVSVSDEVLFRIKSDSGCSTATPRIVVIFPREAPNETCRELFLRAMSSCEPLRILDARTNWAVHALEKTLRKMNRTWGATPAFLLRSWTRAGLDARAVFASGRPYISFTPEETELGWAALADLGIEQGAEYICFSVRDRAYLAERYGRGSGQRGSHQSVHDYRNPPLDGYKRAIERLLSDGLVVVRMGRFVERRLNIEHPNFVEYAGGPSWSDFLDVFLYAHCQFAFHGGSSGIDSLSATFAKPMCVVDVVPWLHTLYSTSLLITNPAMIKEVDSGRVLSVAEMVSSFRSKSSDYEDDGLTMMRNSPREIDEAVLELQSRIAGTWEMTTCDREVQELFWGGMPNPAALYEGLGHNFTDGRGKSVFIGKKFLDNHLSELLGQESRPTSIDDG